MNISIFGLGYVGTVSLGCLARDGHRVVGVDIVPHKLEMFRHGKSPIIEEGIQELISEVMATGRVSVTDDTVQALKDTEISFVFVGTPSASHGNQDQTALFKIAAQFGAALREKSSRHIFVFRSTVVPRTLEDFLIPIIEKESGKKCGIHFDTCFQPEFLREGSSIKDYDRPPFTVIGSQTDYAIEKLRQIFGHLPCDFYHTSIRTAEMLKYCCNNFHALKIAFANEVARLCESLKINPFKVMELFCKDKQLNISKAYLKPGFAFGGSCLPKDLRATMYIAKHFDITLPLTDSILNSNRVHIDHAITKVIHRGSRKVALIGLSFKAGTDDLRESPLVTLAEQLIGKGFSLMIYDDEVLLSRLLGANRQYIEDHIPHIGKLLNSDLKTVADSSDTLLLGSSNKELYAALRKLLTPKHYLIDLVGLENRDDLVCQYEGLAW